MRTEQTETSLKVVGTYITRNAQTRMYVVKLIDHDETVDLLEFSTSDGKVWTAAGYTKDPAGARQQARDYWF